tara:strand:- start:1758 stop:2189 length:432 start_codon:yes stop_codon:yes gene_type:complete
MKNIYLIIFSFICFYSQSQFEVSEGEQRWEVIGSKQDGTVFLKLQGSNLYKFSFKNYHSKNKIIQSIYFNSTPTDIRNLNNFLLNSFDLTESVSSSLKIDKYVFQVSKSDDYIKVNIISNKSKETVGWAPFTRKDINNLFGKY